MAKANKYYVEVKDGGATIKYGFKTGADYTGILDELGVTDLSQSESNSDGVVYGVNHPKPVRVTIHYKVSDTSDQTRSVKRFASTTNTMKDLVGKEIMIRGKAYKIDSVTSNVPKAASSGGTP